MASFLVIFNVACNIVWWIIILQVILSWLVAFNVLNTHQPFVRSIWYSLNRLTEPVYGRIRRVLPDMGGLDLSPLIVLFGLFALQVVVNNNLAPLAYR